MNKRQTLFTIILLGFTVLDQFVKLWARHELTQSETMPYPWVGVFEIKLTFNQGIAFGFFQGKGVLLAPIAIAIAAATVWHMFRSPNESKWNAFGFGLLAAGALGNLIDRVVFQRVTDLFWFRLINFPVFNVADSCITVATIMLIIGWWTETSHQKPGPEPQPASVEELPSS
jgi:signal peptidase II